MKILIVTTNTRDLCAFWRSVGPWQTLVKTDKTIETELILTAGSAGWEYVQKFDLIFMQRACSKEDVMILQLARNQNIPVWVDYDDWLLDVPGWNPAASLYHDPIRQKNIATIIACADLVSTSTKELGRQCAKVNSNVIVIPNAYPKSMFSYALKEPGPRNKTVVWRGTNTHDGDILSVYQMWSKIPEHVHFMGSPPWILVNSLDPTKYTLHGHKDPFEYFKTLHEMSPTVLTFPLFDCVFNRCKSNIAWIEAIHAGALCIAPDWEEWQQPGIINYDSKAPKTFLEAINKVFNMTPEQVKTQVTDARELIHNGELSMGTQNSIRRDLADVIKQENTLDPLAPDTGAGALAKLLPRNT